MVFPAEVLKVKKHLQETCDARIKTMRLLTEPKETEDLDDENAIYDSDLESMWTKMMTASEAGRMPLTGEPVIYRFLDMIIDASRDLPKYFKLNAKEKESDIKKIHKCTKGLQDIYKHLSCFEAEKIKNLLQSYEEKAVNEIRQSYQRGKLGENFESIVFVRKLTEINMFVYGQQLNSVTVVAAAAIYGGKRYDENDISTLINRGCSH